ncbi:MAG: hypothetical protein UT55_C0009G0027 [Candidatus Peregrinibacteria bacterium GW2011_GWE2_39_6]|nr:MAG: hypothetical protein UT36_C0014G0025 [Candidatus Peregrinibacteria bacterium GW2011_GWF2_39_17]KKR26395.1 MAG: hypothetical protein UT55_C0009G0027 [Candidatus Peregrinibacteria bacterium GW2011_GWE2_39_6]
MRASQSLNKYIQIFKMKNPPAAPTSPEARIDAPFADQLGQFISRILQENVENFKAKRVPRQRILEWVAEGLYIPIGDLTGCHNVLRVKLESQMSIQAIVTTVTQWLNDHEIAEEKRSSNCAYTESNLKNAIDSHLEEFHPIASAKEPEVNQEERAAEGEITRIRKSLANRIVKVMGFKIGYNTILEATLRGMRTTLLRAPFMEACLKEAVKAPNKAVIHNLQALLSGLDNIIGETAVKEFEQGANKVLDEIEAEKARNPFDYNF